MDCVECFRYLRCYACEKMLKCQEVKRMAKRKECFVCDMDCDDMEEADLTKLHDALAEMQRADK